MLRWYWTLLCTVTPFPCLIVTSSRSAHRSCRIHVASCLSPPGCHVHAVANVQGFPCTPPARGSLLMPHLCLKSTVLHTVYHAPPRSASTRCSVLPPSRLYSAAVLSSALSNTLAMYPVQLPTHHPLAPPSNCLRSTSAFPNLHPSSPELRYATRASAS